MQKADRLMRLFQAGSQYFNFTGIDYLGEAAPKKGLTSLRLRMKCSWRVIRFEQFSWCGRKLSSLVVIPIILSRS